VGAVTGLIAHHLTPVTLLVNAAVLGAVLALFGGIWLRERRRRVNRSRRVPTMRE
jgi:hypothetical protein